MTETDPQSTEQELSRVGSGVPDPGEIGFDDPGRFLNRDIQWLEFNRRVLFQAIDPRTPLLERVRFLSSTSRNLDEFFMKRIGGLKRRRDLRLGAQYFETLPPERQLEELRSVVIDLMGLQQRCFRHDVLPTLVEAGIELLGWDDLTDDEKRDAESWYRANIFPILTPLAVDPGHRFPFISNLSVSIGVMLRRAGETEELFARVKVPEVPCRLYDLGDGRRFVPVQELIEHNLDDLFPGMEILRILPFRVTRNADVEEESEDAEDLLEHIQQQLRERRFASVVRLEVGENPDPRVLKLVLDELDLDESDVYETDRLLDYGILDDIADLDVPEMRFQPWRPVVPRGLEGDSSDLLAAIRSGDMIVHMPYESFDATVERFVEQAAADPRVLCIKQTLYRTSGDSPFIPSLIKAAESGKQVAVLVELRARFDEARNIHWAGKLEDAGVHVAYGVVGLKTHTKTVLVVRQEAGGIRCYAYIGTGNFNSKTAGLYEDVGLFTADPAITEDLVTLFNYMTGRSRQREYNKLLIAPTTMKSIFLDYIEREIMVGTPERPGRIICKMNQLEDREVSDALYRASQAGVQIDCVVRGFCCLRAGVPGLSENIRIYSIIGRFLEHSRIFWFSGGREDPLDGDFIIGSADWMYRNLHNRVEAATPVENRALRSRLWEILMINLEDHRQSWQMRSDGTYALRDVSRLAEDDSRMEGTHARLMRLMRERTESDG
ncbi:MAG: polyphosphate kinase 1 [Phycisphaerae bacterium]|nr:polyphosphate kinase 1 [Phycisphaerae bacterium]OUX01184.1 MAG: polyphosphate kinase 1 [Phycisphaeraceae bacterium TMED231]